MSIQQRPGKRRENEENLEELVETVLTPERFHAIKKETGLETEYEDLSYNRKLGILTEMANGGYDSTEFNSEGLERIRGVNSNMAEGYSRKDIERILTGEPPEEERTYDVKTREANNLEDYTSVEGKGNLLGLEQSTFTYFAPGKKSGNGMVILDPDTLEER